MGSFKDKKEIMKFAALCLLAVAAAHPHKKGKWGHKRHQKEHDHPVIDYVVETYNTIETAIQDLVSDVPAVPSQW